MISIRLNKVLKILVVGGRALIATQFPYLKKNEPGHPWQAAG